MFVCPADKRCCYHSAGILLWVEKISIYGCFTSFVKGSTLIPYPCQPALKSSSCPNHSKGLQKVKILDILPFLLCHEGVGDSPVVNRLKSSFFSILALKTEDYEVVSTISNLTPSEMIRNPDELL